MLFTLLGRLMVRTVVASPATPT